MAHETPLSKSWEMIYYDADRSEGSTDFEVLPTERRVEFLHHYAGQAKRWFSDPLLETVVVNDREVEEALSKFKEKPLPRIRRRMSFKNWKYILESSEQTFYATDFDDSSWSEITVPKLFSPDEEEHNLRLRKTFNPGDFKTAMLVVESLADYSKVWVNSRLVRDTTVGITGRSDGRYEPFRINLSDCLKPNVENLIVIEVLRRTEKLRFAIDVPHQTCGEAFGVAGEIALDLNNDRLYIADPFIRAVDVADPCAVKVTYTLINLDEDLGSGEHNVRGQSMGPEPLNAVVEVALFEWFPEESEYPVATAEIPVELLAGGSEIYTVVLNVPAPKLWSLDSPNLYKARIVLKREGRELDECVDTFGIRTIEAPDNHLYLNGRKFFARGILTLNRFSPLNNAKLNMVCPPDVPLVKDLLAFKKMNGKVLRVLARYRGTNSTRMLEICDQLGILLEWATMAHRDYEHLGGIDAIEAVRRIQLPASIKYVRNHPSIIIWEGSNEPGPVDRALLWDDFYRAVRSIDDSRLIEPLSECQRIGSRLPESWAAKEVTRGYHAYCGWYTPFAGIADFLSDKRWFNEDDRHWYQRHQRPIIHTELGTEAMPKWTLYVSESWYKVWSFKDTDRFEKARLGRNLDKDNEWEESQSYQGLVLQCFITKLRMSGIEGVYVCTLADGSSSGLYHKGVLDLYRRAKIGYHILSMSYQDVLVSGVGGRVLLGKDDVFKPSVVNDGEEKRCAIQIEVKDATGQTVDTKVYSNVVLAGETAVTPLAAWKPNLRKRGYYFLEYQVLPGE